MLRTIGDTRPPSFLPVLLRLNPGSFLFSCASFAADLPPWKSLQVVVGPELRRRANFVLFRATQVPFKGCLRAIFYSQQSARIPHEFSGLRPIPKAGMGDPPPSLKKWAVRLCRFLGN